MIATSPDGRWAVVRRGREVSLLADAAGPATSRLELPTEDAELVLVGPPSVLAIVTREPADAGGAALGQVLLHQPPYLDPIARLDLELPMRLAAVTGPRLVLVSHDGNAATIVRVAGRALSAQALVPGSPIEFAVGLDRNQVLFGLWRKLEVWDAVSCRPVLRMNLPLPPPPRTIGPAHGHLWAVRPGSEDVMVCRLSDGRPFHHRVGAVIDEVVSHPASPLLVLATARGLVRLHCLAHTLTAIDAPWQRGMSLAQLVIGDDVSLVGVGDDGDEPWRVPLSGASASPSPATVPGEVDAPIEPAATAADPRSAAISPTVAPASDANDDARPPEPAEPSGGVEPSALEPSGGVEPSALEPSGGVEPSALEPSELAAPVARDGSSGPAGVAAPDLRATPPGEGPAGERTGDVAAVGRSPHGDRAREPAAGATRARGAADGEWRAPLAAYAAELVRGAAPELPAVAPHTELGQLVHRLGLRPGAARALVALYGLYLVGAPALSIARLAHALGEWTEPLGRGELVAHALVRRRGGQIALRSAVTDLFDGVAPRTVRVVGAAAAAPRPGVRRLARDGRTDATLEAALIAKLARIAVIVGPATAAVLEAALHGATAVAFEPPALQPAPWPRDASLVVIAAPAPPAWVAALPSL